MKPIFLRAIVAAACFGMGFVAMDAALADTPTNPNQAQLGSNQGNYPVNTFKGWDVTCGTSATAILTASGYLSGARTVTLINVSDTTLRIGGAEVTTSVGAQLPAGASIVINIDRLGSVTPVLNCAVSGGGKTLSVLGAK